MRKINLTTESIGRLAKKGLGIALPILAMIMYHTSVDDVRNRIRYIGVVSYSDAINAVLDSSMFSSNKEEIIRALPKDGSSDFYKSVMHIVESDMLSSSKVNAIVDMCKQS